MRSVERSYLEQYPCMSEAVLMERVAHEMASYLEQWIRKQSQQGPILFVLGKGNNGADAAATASLLKERGYETVVCPLFSHGSPLLETHLQRYKELGGVVCKDVLENTLWRPNFLACVDGLLGTGSNNALRGSRESQEPQKTQDLVASWIEKINQNSFKGVFAVDLPSGLDGSGNNPSPRVVRATHTFAIGAMKLGYFLQDGWNAVGEIVPISLGLPPSLLDTTITCLEEKDLRIPSPERNQHKYQAGEVILLCGSMPEASSLAAHGAFRAGAGYVRVLSEGKRPPSLPIEAVCVEGTPRETWKTCWKTCWKTWTSRISNRGCVLFGSGWEHDSKVIPLLLDDLLNDLSTQSLALPLVVDGGAIGPYRYPPGTVLTPHWGEAQRLVPRQQQCQRECRQGLEACIEYAVNHGVHIVLKGATTWIISDQGKVQVSSFGMASMATAGMGDVLAGMVAAAKAKGDPIAPYVALHSRLASKASQQHGYGLMASDIIKDVLAGKL